MKEKQLSLPPTRTRVAVDQSTGKQVLVDDYSLILSGMFERARRLTSSKPKDEKGNEPIRL